ncbi:hypothetical protein Taro_019184 [Colocasia esculenta]|uniref:Uncharacterized protein n=1 Tax=Colocasia esculenta TaxID=4460 RepID=A0A843UVP4_COLES|nr:hypothetical protein [Colocasia esculenta]
MIVKQDAKKELTIDHFAQARKISLDDGHITQASKIAQARSSNTNQARRHQCTPRKDPSRMYTRTRVCGYVSNIQQARKYSQRRCNASNHYTPWLTVYL